MRYDYHKQAKVRDIRATLEELYEELYRMAEVLGVNGGSLSQFCDLYFIEHQAKKGLRLRLRGVSKDGTRPHIKTFRSKDAQGLLRFIHLFRAIRHLEGALENMRFL